jgi:hypothetical protein
MKADPIFSVSCTVKETDELIVYNTLSEKVAKDTMYEMLQQGYTNVAVKVVSQFV